METNTWVRLAQDPSKGFGIVGIEKPSGSGWLTVGVYDKDWKELFDAHKGCS